MTSTKYQHIYFFVIFFGAAILLYFIFRSYIVPVFIALICSVVFNSYHEYLEAKLGRNIGALLSVLSVIVIIIVPLCLLSMVIFLEAQSVYGALVHGGSSASLLGTISQNVERHIQPYAPDFHFDLQSYVEGGLNWILANTSTLFTRVFKLLFDLLIMLFALFYLFKDGKQLRSYFMELSPLDQQDDISILKRLETTINSVVRGSLIIAVIQGVQVSLGFAIFGISQPALWGVLAAFASLIPGIGSALVAVPGIAYLFYTGHFINGVGYLIWYFLATTFIDNMLSPHIIERKVNIHPFLILISVLGGIEFLGPIGFLAGPVILAFTSELLKLYPKFATH